MILSGTRKLLTLLVLGFAIMGFLEVPLGEKTGYEHTRDFVTSDDARTATEEVSRSLSEAHEQLENELAQRSDD